MTPIEKAENALNLRIERIQAGLRESRSESARQALFQSLVVCAGIGEALRDYIRTIGHFAQERHGELKQTHDTLTAQHADWLKAGNALLERLNAAPTDRAIRKEIELAQKQMEAIQKTLRRGANALQREVAPSMGMIDHMALSIRRLGDADDMNALKRVTKEVIAHACDLYRTQPTLTAKELIDAAAWEKSALAEIDHVTDFYAAYACAGFQVMRALDLMTLAVSPAPPQTTVEATHRANESVAARLKDITARFTSN